MTIVGLTDSNENNLKAPRGIKDSIKKLIEKQRDELRNCDGVEKDKKLPCMEPLNIKHQPFNLKHSTGELVVFKL